MCLFASNTNKYKHKCVVFFEFINLFSNSVKNEADSVILFQQNKITSMSMNAQQKKNLFQGSFIWWA